MRNELIFEKEYKLDKVLSCIYCHDDILKYDENVEKYYYLPQINAKSYGLSYYKNKKSLTVSSRDFVDKTFSFYHNDKFYKFSCSVPNSEEIIDVPDYYTVRAETLLSAAICERLEDGRIRYIQLTQCDLKMNVPSFMMNRYIPTATTTWYNNVLNHYKKCYSDK